MSHVWITSDRTGAVLIAAVVLTAAVLALHY
jgi:hypothetical protein